MSLRNEGQCPQSTGFLQSTMSMCRCLGWILTYGAGLSFEQEWKEARADTFFFHTHWNPSLGKWVWSSLLAWKCSTDWYCHYVQEERKWTVAWHAPSNPFHPARILEATQRRFHEAFIFQFEQVRSSTSKSNLGEIFSGSFVWTGVVRVATFQKVFFKPVSTEGIHFFWLTNKMKPMEKTPGKSTWENLNLIHLLEHTQCLWSKTVWIVKTQGPRPPFRWRVQLLGQQLLPLCGGGSWEAARLEWVRQTRNH